VMMEGIEEVEEEGWMMGLRRGLQGLIVQREQRR